MNQIKQVFMLAPQTQLVILLPNDLSMIDYRDMISIKFLWNKKAIIIANGPIYFNIQDLQLQLRSVLENGLILHRSITVDIGYLENKFDKNSKGFILTDPTDRYSTWVGAQYHLWHVHVHEISYTTWLYNDHDNNIIFEITPSYPYFFCDIKKQRYFVPYKQWIKNYKPYFKTQLSRETAQQWYKQADHFVKTVDDNSARWKKECEEKRCGKCK